MSRPKGSKNKVTRGAPLKAQKSPVSDVIKEVDGYHASIKIFGKTYEAEGSTVFQAIANLAPEGVVRGVTVLTLKKNDVTQERILPKLATVRLFAPSKMMREQALKITTERFSI